ncbi:hypothetical protein BS47DRAFT_1387861 [Hydnum rufescens UP504]|uniref:Uncharacterized protein n=1 Tax=Hydnum rufescens UP504 TaxID=1448309 RepID=A0A9P6B9F9_9AGAM|nr:hypothetical protein BS47DRAFT_1387861 [Hydnum rufescens UP504]
MREDRLLQVWQSLPHILHDSGKLYARPPKLPQRVLELGLADFLMNMRGRFIAWLRVSSMKTEPFFIDLVKTVEPSSFLALPGTLALTDSDWSRNRPNEWLVGRLLSVFCIVASSPNPAYSSMLWFPRILTHSLKPGYPPRLFPYFLVKGEGRTEKKDIILHPMTCIVCSVRALTPPQLEDGSFNPLSIFFPVAGIFVEVTNLSIRFLSLRMIESALGTTRSSTFPLSIRNRRPSPTHGSRSLIIVPNAYYAPTEMDDAAFDSFILTGRGLYVFRATISNNCSLSARCFRYFAQLLEIKGRKPVTDVKRRRLLITPADMEIICSVPEDREGIYILDTADCDDPLKVASTFHPRIFHAMSSLWPTGNSQL